MIGTKSQVLKWVIDNCKEDKLYRVTDYHEKRSLTANAYYHKLKTLLAAKLRTTPDELHYIFVTQKCPVVYEENGQHCVVALKRNVPVKMLPGYWMPYREQGDLIAYMRLKGSSDMDSKEFSRLVDEMVEECKEQGIETLTPAEMERLKGYEKQTSKSL